MKCIKCNDAQAILHRTSPIGETPANWMCMKCIEKNEPELAKNLKDDPDFSVLEDIADAFYISKNKVEHFKQFSAEFPKRFD